MTCSKFWTKVKENFDLNGISEVYFWKSEWETFDPSDRSTHISYLFLTYRLLYAVYFTVTLFMELVWTPPQRLPYWPIYLTNWSYLLQVVHSLLAFFVVVEAKWEHLQPDPWGAGHAEFIGYKHKVTLPFLNKATLMFYNVANMLPVGVTVLYWVAVYDGSQGSLLQTISTYLVHVVNSILAVLNLVIVAIPVHVTHFVFGLIVLLCYLVFTILYEVLGGTYENGTTYIYEVLNWKENPEGAAITALIAFATFLLTYIIFAWGISKFRSYLASQLTIRSNYCPL